MVSLYFSTEFSLFPSFLDKICSVSDILFFMQLTVLSGCHLIAFFKRHAETTGSIITNRSSDLHHTVLGRTKQISRLLQPMLLQVSVDRLPVQLTKTALQKRGGHLKPSSQRLNGQRFFHMRQHIIMHRPNRFPLILVVISFRTSCLFGRCFLLTKEIKPFQHRQKQISVLVFRRQLCKRKLQTAAPKLISKNHAAVIFF